MRNVLDLAAEETQGVVALVPSVDGVPLVDLVGDFEASRGFAPAGS
jgi:hypothetical protein